MILNGWVGHPSAWLLLILAWLSLGTLFTLVFGVIARMSSQE